MNSEELGGAKFLLGTMKTKWVCANSGRGLVLLVASREREASVLAWSVAPFLQWTAPAEGALFVFGGRSGRLGDARQYLASVEFLDPTVLEWRRGPDMRVARVGLAAAYLAGGYYVIGGYNQISGEDTQRSVERLDVATMQWGACAPLLVPRYGHSACACEGKLYVMGGDHAGALIPFAERYDPETNTWERLPDMPLRVAASRAVAIGGKVHVFGGCDPSVPGDRASDAILLFDPQRGVWTVMVQRMTTGRTAFALAYLPEQESVLIAGGFDLSSRPELEMHSVERIVLDRQPEEIEVPALPALPVARAGCQGVALSELPFGSSLAMVVLGGEYVDPATGVCRVFDTASMMTSPGSRRKSSLANSLKDYSLQLVKRAMKLSTEPGWSDSILPPMQFKRTAFAACVGSVWPQGYPYGGTVTLSWSNWMMRRSG